MTIESFLELIDATQTIDVYVDGACKGNPGMGGYGVFLNQNTHKLETFGGEKETTNNRMELLAPIKGLSMFPHPHILKVHTDSQYVRRGITEWILKWKQNGWKTSKTGLVKNRDLWEELDRLNNIHKVEWVWVKGHDGIYGNELADALANKAVIAQNMSI